MSDVVEPAVVASRDYTQRDLIVQVKTTLDILVIPELTAIREEQERQRIDIDTLKQARAVDEAEESAVAVARHARWSRAEKIAGGIGFVAMLVAVTFGSAFAYHLLVYAH